MWHSNDKYRKVVYRCNKKYSGEHKCITPAIIEKEIKQAFVKAMNKLLENRDEIIEGIGLMQTLLCNLDEIEEERIRLENEISVVREMTKKVVAASGSGIDEQDESAKRYEELQRYDRRYGDKERVSGPRRRTSWITRIQQETAIEVA